MLAQELENIISEYPQIVIETSLRAMLRRTIAFETKYEKHFYDFSKNEIFEMYRSVGSISVTSLQNYNLILKKSANYIFKKYNLCKQNIYVRISKKELHSCVDIYKIKKRFIDKNQLLEIENHLLNYTDRAILDLLFRGIGCEDWAVELTFLQWEQVDKEKMIISLHNGKKIDIEPYSYELLKRSLTETELVSYSGYRCSKVEGKGIVYKQRFNAIENSDDRFEQADKERRFRWLQRRLKIIGDYIGISLTPTSLCDSGLLHHISQGVEKEKIPFREYVRTDECKKIADTYGIHSEYYYVTLIDKFKKYFEEDKTVLTGND